MKTEMQELLNILACPACHGDLTLLDKNGDLAFFCSKCDLVYPIENGIPIMLVSQASSREKWERGED